MQAEFFGIQGLTDEDRGYTGSRFADVRAALMADPYERPLPTYKVTLPSVLRGIWPRGEPYHFGDAVARTVDSLADLRWGPDRKGFRRLLHPNGVCLFGKWAITRETNYSGYFRNGSESLVIARYSTCCNATRRGETRSLSLVGKLFPTTDPNHSEPLKTANFITQQDIGGDRTDFINDALLLNAPNTTSYRRGIHAPVLAVEGLVFGRKDRQSTMRQLYAVAELEKPDDEPTRSPQFMRLAVAPETPRIPGEHLDFRDEVMAHIYDDGDPTPKRTLAFDIEVTDDGVTHGPPIFQRRTFKNWRHIGRLTFDSAVVSYNGDHVIHFNHPTWRADRNNPATATRSGGRKVR